MVLSLASALVAVCISLCHAFLVPVKDSAQTRGISRLGRWKGVKPHHSSRRRTVLSQETAVSPADAKSAVESFDGVFRHSSWARAFRPQLSDHSYALRETDVEGSIPEDLVGTYWKMGPALFRRGDEWVRNAMDGDGYLTAVSIAPSPDDSGGPGDDAEKGEDSPRVWVHSRFVRTSAIEKEDRAGRFLERGVFGTSGDPSKSSNPLTKMAGVVADLMGLSEGDDARDALLRGADHFARPQLKNPSNTNVVEWPPKRFPGPSSSSSSSSSASQEATGPEKKKRVNGYTSSECLKRQVLALHESSRPHQVDVSALETLWPRKAKRDGGDSPSPTGEGEALETEFDLGGILGAGMSSSIQLPEGLEHMIEEIEASSGIGGQSFTAHPKLDSLRNRMVAFSWQLVTNLSGEGDKGIFFLRLRLLEFGSEGELVRETVYEIPDCKGAPHDWAVTSDFYVVVDPRMDFDIASFYLKGKPPAQCLRNQDVPQIVHLIPRRDGKFAGRKPVAIPLNQPGFPFHLTAFDIPGGVRILWEGWGPEVVADNARSGNLYGSYADPSELTLGPSWEGQPESEWQNEPRPSKGYWPDFARFPLLTLRKADLVFDLAEETDGEAEETETGADRDPSGWRWRVEFDGQEPGWSDVFLCHPRVRPSEETLPPTDLFALLCSTNGASAAPQGLLRVRLKRSEEQGEEEKAAGRSEPSQSDAGWEEDNGSRREWKKKGVGVDLPPFRRDSADVWYAGPACFPTEGCFAASVGRDGETVLRGDSAGEGAGGERGYLLSLVHDDSRDFPYLGVFRADDLASGPVCKLHLRHHVPWGIHTNFSEGKSMLTDVPQEPTL
uniref:Uncharacterized protein n=1 Tax=Chromera velia CCMP2878 TaxID=1169474 RepID=A0A0G4I4I0_9ALVE|eukprot:Cvel_10916.t1-p1 / transcript=Cvel_10916.t1 / gene=Cvel_10916 / organism=Chromera_velia_CCMP2878 / gene_product=Apocarotenoid-15,15'-oxygenase, putative / transcript_product=Apocarotenoid-15,15'-oxygenase, putative / location=Cvel_scaffold670:51028-58842(+) / protein_length=836 / sequence_SO=supercontig / SO=protein_coding / is_pseudo=false